MAQILLASAFVCTLVKGASNEETSSLFRIDGVTGPKRTDFDKAFIAGVARTRLYDLEPPLERAVSLRERRTDPMFCFHFGMKMHWGLK